MQRKVKLEKLNGTLAIMEVYIHTYISKIFQGIKNGNVAKQSCIC